MQYNFENIVTSMIICFTYEMNVGEIRYRQWNPLSTYFGVGLYLLWRTRKGNLGAF